MPPKKAQTKGPFFFFMMEYKQKEEAAGRPFPGGMNEVMKRAGPHWEKLAPYQREPYNLQAKKYKAHPKDLIGERYTAQGIPYSQIENEAQTRRIKEQEILKSITSMIQTAVKDNALEHLVVYFISCNYFCVTATDEYIPAEVGLVKYSLAEGIIDKLNILVDPQELPLGMAHDAELHANECHGLPLPPNANGDKNYGKILQKVFKFTGGSLSRKKLPPLFTFNKEIPIVASILNGFLYEAGIESLEPKIFPLVEYLFYLKQATESYGLDIDSFPSVHMAKALLEKDVYAYTVEIGCEVHEELANTIQCALSKCTRWAYTISDVCCLDLGIDMEGGKHLPPDMTLVSDITETVSCISSRFSKVTLSTDHQSRVSKFRRPRSAERGGDQDTDITSTTIYSSRAGVSKPPPPPKPKVAESFNTTNPFHNLAAAAADEPKQPPKADKPNPWSRESKLSEARAPMQDAGVPMKSGVPIIGRGRGTLDHRKLAVNGRGAVVGRGASSLNFISAIKSAGRGQLNNL